VVVVTDPGVLAHWDDGIVTEDGVDKDRLIHVFTGTPPGKPIDDPDDTG
jgi:hypothetical protein